VKKERCDFVVDCIFSTSYVRIYILNFIKVYTALQLLFCVDMKTGLLVENGVLRRILAPRGEEVTDGYRKLHSEELHSVSASLV
jgi:hypothetical protein